MVQPSSALKSFADRLTARSNLSDSEVQTVLQLRGRRQHIRRNQRTVTSGKTEPELHLVIDGVMARFNDIRKGRQITAVYLPGDVCDLHSVLMPEVQWRLQALSDCEILRIPHVDLRDAARKHPALANAFWRESIADVACLTQWAVNVGRRDASQRLAHLLCELGVRLEHAGSGTRTAYQFEPTQGQIADMLALTAVHVNRTIRSMKDAGLVSMNGRNVEILDWPRLAALGEFHPAYLALDGIPGPQLARSA